MANDYKISPLVCQQVAITEQSLGTLAMSFALVDQLTTNVPSSPYLFFFFSPAPGPQAMTDVHLDTPEGQENASNCGKGSSGTGNQQGHYPCMNNYKWDAMLNSLIGGDLYFHKPHKKLSMGLSQRCTITMSVQLSQAASDSHQARCGKID